MPTLLASSLAPTAGMPAPIGSSALAPAQTVLLQEEGLLPRQGGDWEDRGTDRALWLG